MKIQVAPEIVNRWKQFRVSAVLALLCVSLTSIALGSQERTPGDLNRAFDAANELYEKGSYREAAVAYERIGSSGQISPALFYNLGNAWFKTGEIGRAIASFRAAQNSAPRDPDIRANLQFARQAVSPPTMRLSWWERWLITLTTDEWTLVTSVGYWLCLLVLVGRQWRPAIGRNLRVYLLILIAATAASGICLAQALQLRQSRVAIVTAKTADVRQGPLDESASVFTVHDGAELRVIDRKDDWLQVAPDPKRVGWIHKDQVIATVNTVRGVEASSPIYK